MPNNCHPTPCRQSRPLHLHNTSCPGVKLDALLVKPRGPQGWVHACRHTTPEPDGLLPLFNMVPGKVPGGSALPAHLRETHAAHPPLPAGNPLPHQMPSQTPPLPGRAPRSAGFLLPMNLPAFGHVTHQRQFHKALLAGASRKVYPALPLGPPVSTGQAPSFTQSFSAAQVLRSEVPGRQDLIRRAHHHQQPQTDSFRP